MAYCRCVGVHPIHLQRVGVLWVSWLQAVLLQVLGDAATLCTCGRELLGALGGEAALRALLCSACNDNNIAAPVDAYGGDGSDEEGSNTAGGSVTAHAYRGKQYFAVRIGDSLAGLAGSSLSQRAVVGYHGGDLWCLFCPSGRQRGCVHVQMVQASGEAGSNRSGSGIPWLDASTAEQRLQEALDLAIDKYIITCQSRLPLKQRTRDDPGLLAVLEGQ